VEEGVKGRAGGGGGGILEELLMFRFEKDEGSEPCETLEIARLRFPESLLDEPPFRRVVVCELYEPWEGSKLIAVPGRPPEKESGLELKISAPGILKDIESRLNLEKMVFNVSNLGKITVSRYAVRTIRRTSSA